MDVDSGAEIRTLVNTSIVAHVAGMRVQVPFGFLVGQRHTICIHLAYKFMHGPCDHSQGVYSALETMPLGVHRHLCCHPPGLGKGVQGFVVPDLIGNYIN